MFSKGFVTAVRSFEEKVLDQEARCHFATLIAMLFRSWLNLLESVKTRLSASKETVTEMQAQLKGQQKHEASTRDEYEKKLERATAKLDSKPLMQQTIQLRKENSELRIAMQKERRELEGQIALLNLNNKELTESLRALQESSERVQTLTKIQELSSDLHHTREALIKEKDARSATGFKLCNILDANKREIRERDRRLEELQTKNTALARERGSMTKRLDEVETALKEKSENLAMLWEDMLKAKLRVQKLDRAVADKEAEVQDWANKNAELELQLKLQRQGLLTRGEVTMSGLLAHFANNMECGTTNNQMKAGARKGHENDMCVLGLAKKDEPVVDYNPATSEYRFDSLSLERFQYARPTYRALIAELLPPDGSTADYNPPYPVWLNVTIRGILDSFWNEVLLSFNKNKTIARFPDFVFAWLGAFTVDPATKKVRGLEYTEKDLVCPASRMSLYLGLEVATSTKLWEVHTFKDFLEESLAPDELVFYLHARFLLFSGPQLDLPAATCCVTHFIPKDRTYDLIERIMHKYPHDERKRLRKKLVEFSRATYKDTNAYDASMVLRILLEYYRKQKKENVAKFSELYKSEKSSHPGHSASIFSFSAFYNLVCGAYDSDITDAEASALYREAYIAGGCCVNLDSILLAFNESYRAFHAKTR